MQIFATGADARRERVHKFVKEWCRFGQPAILQGMSVLEVRDCRANIACSPKMCRYLANLLADAKPSKYLSHNLVAARDSGDAAERAINAHKVVADKVGREPIIYGGQRTGCGGQRVFDRLQVAKVVYRTHAGSGQRARLFVQNRFEFFQPVTRKRAYIDGKTARTLA